LARSKVKTPVRNEDKMVTFVVIPHHGANMMQWRIPRWFLALVFVVGSTMLGGAGWVLAQELNFRVESEQVKRFKQTNIQVAEELTKGRQALLRVARLEYDLRRMLAYKNQESLLEKSNTGGPTPEDTARLQALLNQRDPDAVGVANREVHELLAKVEEREKSYDAIRKYVDEKRSFLASKPANWPVRGWVSSKFGRRVSPFSGDQGFHAGIDIANDTGTPIRAAADGVVRFSGWEGGYGKLVVLDHGNGYTTLYGHCSKLNVSVGQKVKRGTMIARMGSTGEATGPHLHYEVRRFGAAVNPMQFLDK
jgi:murein DD-endopeptidase MepM/ murein hydrolase activator NlpD